MNIPQLEAYLKSRIFPDLKKGDPGRDLPHTQSIVLKIKEILRNSLELKLDLEVLLISAFCHDWGYSKFFKTEGIPMTHEEYSEAKKKHMKVGAEMTKELLTEHFFNFLSEERKDRIVHLVSVHDNVFNLKDSDELVLMEADTLAGLDTDFIKPTFSREANEKYIEIGVKKRRRPKFITTYSKQQFDILLKKRQDYYDRHPEL